MLTAGVLEPQTVIDGKYRILRLLGEGAFGRVYEAIELRLDRHIALKTLSIDAGIPNMVERFQREVELIKQIEHGNVVRLYDHGQTQDGQLYMSMEFVKGRELREVLDEEGGLGVARAVNITLQVLDALAEAQTLGVVHRDLKPENILVTQKGARRDVVKLLDFGIAKTVDSGVESVNLTGTGVSCGTPLYMAPEQFEAKNIGPHTDIYAVGLILLEMITGKSPIEAESLFQIVAVHVQTGIKVPERVRESVVGSIVERALNRDWSQRYRSAEDMYQELVEVMGGQIAATSGVGVVAVSSEPTPDVAGSEHAFADTMIGPNDTSSAEVAGFFDDMPNPTAAPRRQVLERPAEAPGGDADWWKDAISTAVGGELSSAKAAVDAVSGPNPVSAPGLRSPLEDIASGPVRAQKPTSSRAATQFTPIKTAAPRSSVLPLVIVALVLVVAVVVAGVVLLTEKETASPGAAAAAETTESAQPPTHAADAPSVEQSGFDADAITQAVGHSATAWAGHVPPKRMVYEITVVSDPDRSTVTLDGKKICRKTPCTFSYERSQAGRVEIAKGGYEPQFVELSRFSTPPSEPIEVALQKQ